MNENHDEFFRAGYAEATRKALDKASSYFDILSASVKKKDFERILRNDFRIWKQKHVKRRFPTLSFSKQQKKMKEDFLLYIRHLEEKGKLLPYLERSMAYIYMRDLGKDLSLPEPRQRIVYAAGNLHKFFREKVISENNREVWFGPEHLYRFAQKEKIEETGIWLIEKLHKAWRHIPPEMDAVHAKRKLLKMIAGVVLHELDELDQEGEVPAQERKSRLETAVKLGYYYGLTYPFVDDLLDSNVMSEGEKKQYAALIRSVLTTGKIPPFSGWQGKNAKLMQYVYEELSEAYTYVLGRLGGDMKMRFLEQAFVFFQSQETDRMKNLQNRSYSNEEIYIPVILKSASSRAIIRAIISAPGEEDMAEKMFYYGIYNQLADDFTDMFADAMLGSVTPYTYYLKYYKERPDLINPFELYWAVIAFLIHEVYQSDGLTREIILSRAINSLKRFKERNGTEKYEEVMRIFASGMPELNNVIQYMVKRAVDVDFLDKWIRDRMIVSLRKEQEEQEKFIAFFKDARKKINNVLPVSNEEQDELPGGQIVDAANYVLKSGGKRLRSVIALMVGKSSYGFKEESLYPLMKALEYMHTASLVFDDLPSQDNSGLRRGRPTLHKIYDVATAELTGLYLTQKATEELASLESFTPDRVLEAIRYTSHVAMDICRGQMEDLLNVGKEMSLEELNEMSFYKTGLAFEAAVLVPAILAGADKEEQEALKRFAYHAGIAFQIKDDLLDAEGDETVLGKPVGQDEDKLQATFVTVLGKIGAKKAMWDHYCQAIDTLDILPGDTSYLAQLLTFIVMREQ